VHAHPRAECTCPRDNWRGSLADKTDFYLHQCSRTPFDNGRVPQCAEVRRKRSGVNLSEWHVVELGSSELHAPSYIDTGYRQRRHLFDSGRMHSVSQRGYSKLNGVEGHSKISNNKVIWRPTEFIAKTDFGESTGHHTLIEAVIIVVMCVIVFLQTWRDSIIP